MKWIKNKNVMKVLTAVGENLNQDVMEMSDVDLFEDRLEFIRKDINDYFNYERKSNDNFDMRNVYDTDIHTIAILIGQVVTFGRIVMKNNSGELMFPKDKMPYFMNMVECSPYHSSGKRIKNKIRRGVYDDLGYKKTFKKK